MAENKKFLDSNGVSILWSRINQKFAEKSALEALEGRVDELATSGYDDTELRGLIKNNTDAISTLNGTGEGSVSKKVADEIAKIVNDNNNGSIDTLNEIAAWIVNDTTGAADMANDIAALQNKLEGVDSTVVETVGGLISEALTADGVDKYALASDLTNLAGRVDTLEKAGYQTAAQVNTAISNEIANIPTVSGLSEAEIDSAIAAAPAPTPAPAA